MKRGGSVDVSIRARACRRFASCQASPKVDCASGSSLNHRSLRRGRSITYGARAPASSSYKHRRYRTSSVPAGVSRERFKVTTFVLWLDCQRAESVAFVLDNSQFGEACGDNCVTQSIFQLAGVGRKAQRDPDPGFHYPSDFLNPTTASGQTCIELIVSTLSK